jgi:hypothetical protein
MAHNPHEAAPQKDEQNTHRVDRDHGRDPDPLLAGTPPPPPQTDPPPRGGDDDDNEQ